jgi:iron(III) transport system substrate-binding protein
VLISLFAASSDTSLRVPQTDQLAMSVRREVWSPKNKFSEANNRYCEEEGILLKSSITSLTVGIVTTVFLYVWFCSIAIAAQSPDQLYAELMKLKPDQRAKRLEEGARKEGKLTFVHTWRGKIARDFGSAFEKRYPYIKFEMSDLGSQDAAERFVAEERTGRHLTDILSLAVPDLAVILKQNLVARYPTPATNKILKQYRGFVDPENRWTAWYWSEHGISYNTNLVSAAQAPKDWFDLCKPTFKGQVSFDPAETRFLAGLYTMMGEEKTKQWLKCIGENQPIVQTGHTQRMELMLTGDHAVQGDNYLYAGIEAMKKNPKTPYAIVYTAPILAFAGSMVINKNTQNPHAAALLADWAVSDEAQKLTSDVLRGPLTIKHPYLPDDIKLVTYNIVSEEITNRLHEAWNQYIGRMK